MTGDGEMPVGLTGFLWLRDSQMSVFGVAAVPLVFCNFGIWRDHLFVLACTVSLIFCFLFFFSVFLF